MKNALIAGSLLVLSAPSFAATENFREAWDYQNAPVQIGKNYNRKWSELPRYYQMSEKPWTGSYWPSYRGGIAYRYNSNRPLKTPFRFRGYRTKSYRKVRKMSHEKLASLSPAEKYDIYMGNYNYPTVKSERSRTSPRRPSWEGLCHGWAPAAANFHEPRPVEMVNPDGVVVPFGSSDVKALLTYYQGNIGEARSKFLGIRCNVDLNRNPGMGETSACKGVNPGSFHIVLANELALKGHPFIMDVTRDAEVWNHPIFGYKMKELRAYSGASVGSAPGTVKEVEFETSVFYTVEIQANWYPKNDTDGYAYEVKSYRYRIEIDEDDNIIGGTWLSDDRPDFLWSQKAPSFKGYYGGIKRIYEKSIGR